MTLNRGAPQFHVKILKEGVAKAERIGVDVDAKILTLSFEDTEKMHKLKMTVDNFDLRHFDKPIIKTGNILEFSFGYPGSMSPPREAVVTKVTGGTVLAIEALGKEYLMHKVLKSRRFEQMSRSQIARQVAEENGYGQAEQDIEDTVEVLRWTLQVRQTDYGLLRELAGKEGFELYCDGTGFHFHKRRLGQKPKRVFTWYTGGDLLEFPKIEIDITSKPGAVTAVGRDPLKKTDIKEKADNASTTGRPALAPVVEVVDVATGQTSLQTRTATETTVATTATSAADAKNQAKGAYQKSQMAAVKFKVNCVGDPQMSAKTIVTFAGIGALLNGNYYLATVTHKFGHSYTMELDCRRDGSNGAGGSGGGTPAKSLGKKNDAVPDPHTGMVAVEVVDEATATTRVEWRKK